MRERVEPADWQGLLQRNVPFGTLELLQRLFDADPEQAAGLLPKIIKGEVTFRAMREILSIAVKAGGGGNGRAVYANRASQFKKRALLSIRANNGQFVGALEPETAVEFRATLLGFQYARPDLMLLGWSKKAPRTSGPIFVAAFEVKLFGQVDINNVLVRQVEEIAMLEKFFRQIWLIYPGSTPPVESHEEFLKKLSQYLTALGMNSVGFASVPEETHPSGSDAPVIRRWPTPNPKPLRVAILREHLQVPA